MSWKTGIRRRDYKIINCSKCNQQIQVYADAEDTIVCSECVEAVGNQKLQEVELTKPYGKRIDGVNFPYYMVKDYEALWKYCNQLEKKLKELTK